MRACLAALIFAFLTASAAAQPCMPRDQAMAIVIADPATAAHTELIGPGVKVASDLFNAVPPESDTAWTAAILVELSTGGGVLLVGNGQEICGSLWVAPAQWPAVVRAIRGAGA